MYSHGLPDGCVCEFVCGMQLPIIAVLVTGLSLQRLSCVIITYYFYVCVDACVYVTTFLCFVEGIW